MNEPVIVIGSGAAGLTAALTASRHGDVLLLTKGELGAGNSRLAQGGIAAVLDAATTSGSGGADSVAAHIEDTLAAGAWLGDPAHVRVLCEEGPDRIRDLMNLGLRFDQSADGMLARGLEAAHSAPRILHAGGDATGRALVATLCAAVRAAPIAVIEHAFVADFVVAEGSVVGVEALVRGRRRRFPARAVIVATGGVGQLYRHTTNPLGATGDGVAAALRAGATVADAEFVQFHPTALRVAGTPLISEAVRGEGAWLVDGDGTRFMLDEHPDAELAPRDVVARAIARRTHSTGQPVFLDARPIGADRLASRFPGFVALAKRHGLNPAAEPVPVTPAAHYWMGGIATDEFGRSSVPGLLAAGEAANTRVHGANRLASNSLLEALVFAHRAASSLSDAASTLTPLGGAPHDTGGSEVTRTAAVPMSRETLQELMWHNVGLERDTEGLAAASERLASAWVDGDDIEDLETRNLLQLARVVTESALRRPGSIGSHHRTDTGAPRSNRGHGAAHADPLASRATLTLEPTLATGAAVTAPPTVTPQPTRNAPPTLTTPSDTKEALSA